MVCSSFSKRLTRIIFSDFWVLSGSHFVVQAVHSGCANNALLVVTFPRYRDLTAITLQGEVEMSNTLTKCLKQPF